MRALLFLFLLVAACTPVTFGTVDCDAGPGICDAIDSGSDAGDAADAQ